MKRKNMGEILKTITGQVCGNGIVTNEGQFMVYEYVEIKNDQETVRFESVAMNKEMAIAMKTGRAFQFADSKNFNTHFKHQFLCAVQAKNGDVVSDDRVLKGAFKVRRFLAFLSLIPPATIVAPFVFKKAGEIKAACEQVGEFDPIDKNFYRNVKKKKM